MAEGKSIFDDRRKRHERRKQSLSIPAGLDRRKNARRHRRFSARDWWLDTDYAIELIGEKKVDPRPDINITTRNKARHREKPENSGL